MTHFYQKMTLFQMLNLTTPNTTSSNFVSHRHSFTKPLKAFVYQSEYLVIYCYKEGWNSSECFGINQTT